MSYYFLPRVILYENNKETKKLNNLSSNYSDLFYKQLAQDLDEDIPSLVSQQIVTEGALLLTDDVQNFLLGTSEYANDIQSDIGLFVTKGRFNEASVTHKHDPIVKGVWRTENRLALHFKDVATFGAQNPIIGSLLKEVDLKKKGRNSDLIRKQLEKALDINDTILIQRFKKFKDDPINFNNSDDKNDNDDNNNKPTGQPPPPPTFNDFSEFFQTLPAASYEAPSVFQTPPATSYKTPSVFQPQQQPKNTFDRIGSAPIAPSE